MPCRYRRNLRLAFAVVAGLTALAWALGYWHLLAIGIGHGGRYWSAGVGDGVLMVCAAAPATLRPHGWSIATGDQVPLPVRYPEGSFYAARLGGWDGWAVAAPMWFVTAALVIGGMCLAFRRRHRVGMCRTCGYDLRASPDRCPECGTEVTSLGGRQGDAAASRTRANG